MARMKHLLLLALAALLLAQPFKLARAYGDFQAGAGSSDDDYVDEGEGEGEFESEGEVAEREWGDLGSDDFSEFQAEGTQEYNDEEVLYDDEEGEGEEGGGDLDDSDDGDVIKLTKAIFADFVRLNRHVLVEFYAPWCGHCKELAPEYKEAATLLKDEGVKVAKVDATVETELAEEYGVDGYPTLLFFIDGKPKPFGSARTSQEIYEWVSKKLGPAVVAVSSKEQVDEVLLAESVISIGFFADLQSAEFKEYESAVQAVEGVFAVATTDIHIAHMFGLPMASTSPTVAIIKDEEETYVQFDGKLTSPSLEKFLIDNRLPLVITFSEESAEKIFGGKIEHHIFLFVTDEKVHDFIAPFEEAAKDFKSQIIFVHVNTTSMEDAKSIADFFGVNNLKTSIIGFASAPSENKKYMFDQEFSTDNVKAFARDFLAGVAKTYLKSDPIPENNKDGDVTTVVGHTFDSIVLNNSADVLLEVYAPWCGHCQALEPVWQQLGKRFSAVPSVVIAKMDGTGNEHESIKVEGFPMLVFYPAGVKADEAITVDAERKLKALTQFIKKHAKIPFTLPKKGDLKGEAGSAGDQAGQAGGGNDGDYDSEDRRDEL